MQVHKQHWGIVGGGMLGMSLAHELTKRGCRCTLIESGESLGGLAGAWRLGDVVWDRHYHVILLSDSHLRSLLDELGLESETEWAQTRTGFYTGGKFHSMSNAIEFLRFPPLNLIEKLRLGGTIFYASRIRNWRALENVLVADWLSRLSGAGTFEKIWLPLLRAKLGAAYRHTSAAFIWATIARMYAARRSGLKQEMFGYVRSGYARILERFELLLRREGVAVELGRPVRAVESAEDGQVGVEYADGTRDRFDQVVLTVPAPIATKLCPGLGEDERSRWQRVEYLGIVCASLLLDRPLSDFYITNITDDWVPFTAVIEMSALVDPARFGGNSLVYLPKYVAPNDALFTTPDAEIEATCVEALARMHPGFTRDRLLGFRVSRAKHVFALPTLGYSRNLPPMSTSIPGIHLVNSAHIVNGTLNINETLQLAKRAIPEILPQAAPRDARTAVGVPPA